MNSNLLLIFLGLFAGAGLRRFQRLPANAAQTLNTFVIYVSLPALILEQFPPLLKTLTWSSDLLIPVSMAWICFLLTFAVFFLLGKKYGWSSTVTGALILTAGLGNTSFVGFPILESLYGAAAIRVGVLVDQPGTFLVLATLGILVASSLSSQAGRRFEFSAMFRRVISFPPFVAMILAALWSMLGSFGHEQIDPMVGRLAGTLIPIALVAVGLQLRISPAVLRRRWRLLTLGLVYKLFLTPAFFALLYAGVFASRSFSTHITILESAMAPMITATVVAEEFGFDAEIANLMLGLGIPLSILTVRLWDYILS